MPISGTDQSMSSVSVPIIGSDRVLGILALEDHTREHAYGEPELAHTLNYLTFPDDPMVVGGPDQLQIDAFYRYNESLQRFFNGASSIATSGQSSRANKLRKPGEPMRSGAT